MTHDDFLQRVFTALRNLEEEGGISAGYVVRIHPEDWYHIRLTMAVSTWVTISPDHVFGLLIERTTDVEPGQITLRREVAA